MATDDQGRLTALDYTHIFKHVGRLFTAGDVSLSAIGGIHLPAAGMAFAATAPISVISWVVISLFLGQTVWLALLVALVFGVVIYLLLARDAEDKERIEARLLVWANAKVKQPTSLSGQVKDTHPTNLRWTVIMWRPDNEHVVAGRPKNTAHQYNPRPFASSYWEVADDSAAHLDWYEELSRTAPKELK